MFRSLVQTVKDYAILAVDLQGRVISWNQGAEVIFGYRADEIIGEHYSQLHPPESVAWGKPSHVLKVASELGRCEDEGFLVRKGGKVFWGNVVTTAIRDQGGPVISYCKIVRDLTERRRQEQLLKDQEARLRNIVDQAVDGIITINDRGTIESVNPAVERIFGYVSDELIGQNVNLLMPNPYHDEHDQYLDNYHRTGVKQIIGIGREVLGRRRDGTIFPVDLAVSEVQLGDRRLFTGIVRDITERKRSEQALRDSEARHRAIFQSAVDGIVTIDQHGIIESVNPATERLFGYSADELIGQNVDMLMPTPYHEQHQQYLINYLTTGDKKIIGIGREVIGKRKDGTIFPMDLAVSEMYIGGRRMFTGLIHDVTDRKQAEQERDRLLTSERTARAEAERANKSKDEFLAALSHELRTPLTPALLTLSLLERDPNFPSRHRADLDVVRRNIEVEARLIDDLLDLTRVVNNKMALDFKIVNVYEILRSAERTCHPDAGIDHVFDLSAEHHHVRADPARLQQVFWNLFSNAHKFTPIGGQLTVRARNPEPGRITVEFVDTGRGIEPALLLTIFNAFEQGDAQLARSFGGLGLGLTISKAIIDAHQGVIVAHSEGKGQGATFRVDLPTVPAETSPSKPSELPTTAKGVRSLRILIVEDHEPTIRIISRLLRDAGHEICTAENVHSACDMLPRRQFDLIISDLGLPDGSGYEVMECAARHNIKGIALSGYGMSEDVRQSREAGFSAHLTKPVDFATLLAAVNAACLSEETSGDKDHSPAGR